MELHEKVCTIEEYLHILRVLTKLYGWGYCYESGEKVGKNYERARVMYERLYRLTQDERYKMELQWLEKDRQREED